MHSTLKQARKNDYYSMVKYLLIFHVTLYLIACDANRFSFKAESAHQRYYPALAMNTDPSHDEEVRIPPYPQQVEMDAVNNFRDLGAYTTVDGRKLKLGRLYRSANFSHATKNDVRFIVGTLGIRDIVDFRSIEEIELEPEPTSLLTAVDYINIPIEVRGTSREDITQRLKNRSSEDDFSDMLLHANQLMAIEHGQQFKAFFDILKDQSGPLVFHCTEGKDRTGFAAAILLTLLGVSPDQVFSDYLLTNKVNKKIIKKRIKKIRLMSFFQIDRKDLRLLLGVDRRYLEAGLTSIITKYGSMKNYYQQALGLDSEDILHLKNKFLEPVDIDRSPTQGM